MKMCAYKEKTRLRKCWGLHGGDVSSRSLLGCDAV